MEPTRPLTNTIETMLLEERRYAPDPEFARQANAQPTIYERDVVRFANALKGLGLKEGTPVGIYMGMVPELPLAMLACARLGAPHTVVFGGFSSEALSDRLNDMECELLITQDEGWRAGKKVPLKVNADEAVAQAPKVKRVVVLQRTGDEVPFDESRDAWWHDLTQAP